jgi:hypothetical protein
MEMGRLVVTVERVNIRNVDTGHIRAADGPTDRRFGRASYKKSLLKV